MQQIPAIQWSDDALKIRQFVYEFWSEHAYGPNLLDLHKATGLGRRRIMDALYQLQLGGLCVLDLDSPHLSLHRFLPYSSYPTVVKGFIGDRFLGYIGCAMESVAFSKMPPYQGQEVRLESFCACCFQPVTVASRDGKTTSEEPASLRIHVGLTPYEWNRVNHNAMCDTMNFVIDADHAQRYERMTARRGVLFTTAQAEGLVKGIADNRMWDYNWPMSPSNPERTLQGIKALGVDTSNWEPDAAAPL